MFFGPRPHFRTSNSCLYPIDDLEFQITGDGYEVSPKRIKQALKNGELEKKVSIQGEQIPGKSIERFEKTLQREADERDRIKAEEQNRRRDAETERRDRIFSLQLDEATRAAEQRRKRDAALDRLAAQEA